MVQTDKSSDTHYEAIVSDAKITCKKCKAGVFTLTPKDISLHQKKEIYVPCICARDNVKTIVYPDGTILKEAVDILPAIEEVKEKIA